jgi:7-carboxy-7-deazaguanine synthase
MMILPVIRSQRLEPLRDKLDGQLVVHEVYRSIQGESTFAGLPCVFVRLTACMARCSWCDTPHAFREGLTRPLDEVFDRVLAFDCPLVELTGGEPLLQPEAFCLMTMLADAGKTVLVETSGLVSIEGVDPRVHVIMDLKCPTAASARITTGATSTVSRRRTRSSLSSRRGATSTGRWRRSGGTASTVASRCY